MDPTTRQELAELAEHYAAGADSHDATRFASAFLPDGQLAVHNPADGPAISLRTGRAELAVVPGLLAARYDVTLHTLANHRYTSDGDDAWRGEVVCIAHHVKRSSGTDYVMHIRYDDHYGRGPDGHWGIALRRCRVLWTTTIAIDP